MTQKSSRRVCAFLPAVFFLSGLVASSQTAPPHTATVEERLNALDSATKSAQSAGDNAWMLISAALVLMMTGPGLALFYGGLVRRKNVLSTMMHSFILMAVVTVIWAVSATVWRSARGSPFIGDLRYLFLHGVGARAQCRTTPPPSRTQTYMIYQLMFAIITPALISGAFAERMKFSAMLLFTAVVAASSISRWRTWFGARAASECVLWAAGSLLRFRRRHGGAHHLRRLGAGLRALSGQARRAIRRKP